MYRCLSILCAVVLICSVLFFDGRYVPKAYASAENGMVETSSAESEMTGTEGLQKLEQTETETKQQAETKQQTEAETIASESETQTAENETVSSERKQEESREDKKENKKETETKPRETETQVLTKETEKELSVYTASTDNVEVKVQAEDGILPKSAKLQLKEICKDTDQYRQVEKKLEEKITGEKKELSGFFAYDISFTDEKQKELEPAGEVKVSISYKKAAVPGDAVDQDTEISVMHLEEDANGTVKNVTDMTGAGKAVVKTNEEKEIIKAEFATETFSVFTIAWVNNGDTRTAQEMTEVKRTGKSAVSTYADEDPKLEHNKTIKKLNTPDQYELALDVTGKVIPPENSDILLIVDVSASMNNNSRKSNVSYAITQLEQKIKDYLKRWSEADRPDIKLAAVEFSGPNRTGSENRSQTSKNGRNGGDANLVWNWTPLDDFSYSVGTCVGGTNWQAGVIEGEKAIQAGDADYKKYVVFLTDGVPTFRYSSGNKAYSSNTYQTYGTGLDSDYQSYTNNNFKAAENQLLNASPGLQQAKTYIVSAASDTIAYCNEFNIQTGGRAQVMDGSNRTELVNNFQKIAEDVVYGTTYTNVVIQDKLSDDVTFAEKDPTISVYRVIKNADGTETETLMKTSEYSAKADTAQGTVRVEILNNQAVEDNTTYRAKFKIVAKTENAIRSLKNHDGTYPDTGDPGTDAAGNNTSSNKKGIYSNDSSNTKLTYTVHNNDQELPYKNPVIQIDTVKQQVTKRWVDSLSQHEEVTAVIAATANGEDVTSKIFTGELAGANEQKLNVANQWTYTWNYLPKYYHTVDINGDDAGYLINYTITEKNVPNGYEMTKEVQTDSEDSSLVKTVLINTAGNADLDLKKTDAATGEYLEGSVFLLSKKNEAGTWDEDNDYTVKNDTAVELKNLSNGLHRLQEKSAPTGHNILAEDIYFIVENGKIYLSDENGNKIDSEQKMWNLEDPQDAQNPQVLTIKNSKIYSLPQTGGMGTCMFTISGAATITTALLLFIKKINERREKGSL